MDEFEKQEILEEFLVRFKGGTSTGIIAKDLVDHGRNPSDVGVCKQIFDKWARTKRSWTEIMRMR